ncbi:hypothetical protein KL921_003946 [Ogataea angusta]|uniref:Uncharacterized protein n=1 Tax=Pichia angusta TaxID=870730 RepID=A0AAN6DDM9_PICAN|nr:uncharacterized protein KL928_004390 [Ogataea angusta]KAG7807651.1 hypothetical protein KL921_003946 [Ogataea angusta]KAG7816926.1 hypothetical protein KL928_004390 [Ogataea angusta]KAG7823345.1 hypothetical protein KL909_003368 [Ogataea angusta]KAG7838003.1 hypothetical protein KL943_000079 [Ogataea angusta]KAG7838860.1 hypothetical protein KL942_003856 [Ogataea angusta]
MSRWPAPAAPMLSTAAPGHLEDGKKGQQRHNCERIGELIGCPPVSFCTPRMGRAARCGYGAFDSSHRTAVT